MINPKKITCQDEVRKSRKTQARERGREYSLVLKEVGKAVVANKATLSFSFCNVNKNNQ